MTELNKELIREDLCFICDYIADMVKRNKLAMSEEKTIMKMDRRVRDILYRLDAK